MEKKRFKDISSDIRANYQAALAAKDIEYGIMLLKGIIQKEPAFIEAREQIRKLEKTKTGHANWFKKTMAGIKTSHTVTLGKTLLAAKKPLDAMKKAEDALSVSLACLPALNLLAQAAQEVDASFITIEALEIAREYFPGNIAVLDWLAREYAEEKMGTNALRIRQEIAALRPGDLEAQQQVRAAAALATMEKGKWEDKESDYRTKLKSEDDAVRLEQEDRIARNIDDVKGLIETYEKQRAEGKDSTDIKRKLADLYQKAELHDKALEYFSMVIKEIGAMDPHIDRAIEKSKLAIIDKSIGEWEQYAKANPDKNAEAKDNIKAFELQKLDYRLERALDRVNSYPNDLQLRYELALVHWDRQEIDEALQQFQLSQKNPHRRLSSIVYLGQCFYKKRQFDIAVEEFTKALGEMIGMDKQKMDAIYHLGLTYEAMGKKNDAMDCFKQIYRANIKFRDVADRVKSLEKI